MNQPPTACSTPNCGGTSIAGGKCEKCQVPAAPAPKPHDYHREWKKLYQCKRWRVLRDAVLRRDPVCVVCNRAAATVADHKKDHRGDVKLFYDFNNLRGVCDECHNEKTGSEHGKGDREKMKPFLEDGRIQDFALDNGKRK